MVDEIGKESDYDTFREKLISKKEKSGKDRPSYAIYDVEFELEGGEGKRCVQSCADIAYVLSAEPQLVDPKSPSLPTSTKTPPVSRYAIHTKFRRPMLTTTVPHGLRQLSRNLEERTKRHCHELASKRPRRVGMGRPSQGSQQGQGHDLRLTNKWPVCDALTRQLSQSNSKSIKGFMQVGVSFDELSIACTGCHAPLEEPTSHAVTTKRGPMH